MSAMDHFSPGTRVMVQSLRDPSHNNMVGTVRGEGTVIRQGAQRAMIQVELEPNAIGRNGGIFWFAAHELRRLAAAGGG